MKKFLLSLAVLTTAFCFSQSVIWSENFDGTPIETPNVGQGNEVPPGFMSYDTNGNGLSWGMSNPSHWTQAIGGVGYVENFIISVSYITGANTPVQAGSLLVTPQITIPAGTTSPSFTFFVGSGTDPNFFAEKFRVRVSSTNDQVGALAGTIIHSETLASQGGSERTLDLSAYVGQSFYLSFEHYNTFDEWVLGLDNLRVEGTLSTDVNIIEGFAYSFNNNTQILSLKANTNFENVTIFNVNGAEVLNTKLFNNLESINLSQFTNGLYFAKVNADNKEMTFKFVK